MASIDQTGSSRGRGRLYAQGRGRSRGASQGYNDTVQGNGRARERARGRGLRGDHDSGPLSGITADQTNMSTIERLDQPRSVPVSSLALERSELSDILDKTLNFDTTKEQRGESETDALVNIATNPSTFASLEGAVQLYNQSSKDGVTRLEEDGSASYKTMAEMTRGKLREDLAKVSTPFGQLRAKTETEYSTAIIENWVLQKSKFYRWGRVFKIKWHEPCGQDISVLRSGEASSQATSSAADPSDNGVFTKYRYFMVADAQDVQCVCLPIQTYGKQGCRKKTLKSSEIRQHAAIYDDTFAKPWYHRDEPIASMRPAIPMRLVNGQKLNKWSRIRFDSPCTVPHNYKILEIGWVHKSHQSSILAYMFEFVQSKMIST